MRHTQINSSASEAEKSLQQVQQYASMKSGADPGGGAQPAPPIFGRQKILKNSFTLICNFTHNRLRKISVSGSLIASSTQFL